ncbi:MAG: YicC family protein [Cryomorphaceae bacterium]|nr:YicC family protein [Cryomorphaceae bacterium]
MIHSMTGYGKAEGQSSNYYITVELRTLNSKGFDLNLRAPGSIRPIEAVIRKSLQDKLQRGKVDVHINLSAAEGNESVPLDLVNLKKLVNALNGVLKETGAQGDALSAAMRMPEMILAQDQTLHDEDREVLLDLLSDAGNQLQKFRAEEGRAMEIDLQSAIHKIGDLLNDITPFESERTDRLRSKIISALESVQPDYNRERFEQELIYYLEKLDINEEKVRLKQHLQYFLNEMQGPVLSGRKLNFIAQEMGREINTLGSKCQHEAIQKKVVEMKDTLEQVKEIILNIV